MRTRKFGLLLFLLACGRSELVTIVEGAAASGEGGAPAAQSRKSGSPAKAPSQQCPTPALPVGLPAGCADALCACAREPFSNCDWNCWSRVACQVATCNNNPTRSECAEGCENAERAELELAHCYLTSKPCSASLQGIPR